MIPNENDLTSLFYPKSVAVIGASRRAGSLGAEVFHNLLGLGYTGVAYPINPHARVVQAVRAYSRVIDIPDPLDLAVVVVPKKYVLAAVEDCITKRVKTIVIISAGFKETGDEGKVLEKEILEKCRKNQIRLVGPNCLGVLNTDPETRLSASFSPIFPPAGDVAFSSQSGALGLAILEFAKELGIGISKFISVGNKADVCENDLVRYWADDPQTKVILLYLESFRDPKSFVKIASEVGRHKPIVAVKSGRSAQGARAAASHTGAMAGSDIMVDTLFRQTGVIRTNTVQELFDVAMFLSNQPLPQGRRVAILTNAGGPGIMAADSCADWNLELSEFTNQTTKKIRSFISKDASVQNPVDLTAAANSETFAKVIPLLLDEPNVDVVLVIYIPPMAIAQQEVAEAIVAATKKSSKPILTCFMGKHGVPEPFRSLRDRHIPSYSFPEEAVAALARVVEHVEWRSKPTGKSITFNDFKPYVTSSVPRDKGWLSQEEVFNVLEAGRISVVRPQFVGSVDKAAKLAEELNVPMALKIDSPRLIHKSDVGGVALDLRTAAEVRTAAQAMIDRAGKIGVTEKEIAGFSIQPMVDEGEEVIIGAKLDPKFGLFFVFGLGGVEVELLRDVAFRFYPFTDHDVDEMIREIRGFELLNGFRGRPRCNLDAVREMILRLGQLISSLPNFRECDLNPVKVSAKGAVVLDARICLTVDRGRHDASETP